MPVFPAKPYINILCTLDVPRAGQGAEQPQHVVDVVGRGVYSCVAKIAWTSSIPVTMTVSYINERYRALESTARGFFHVFVDRGMDTGWPPVQDDR